MSPSNDRHASASGETPFHPPPIPCNAPEPYREFWRLWQAERYYDCHEALEALWQVTRGPHRRFLNGLIHCAVALHQHRRGNALGAARQLVRAQARLAGFEPGYYGVDVGALLLAVERNIGASLASLDAAQRQGCERLRVALDARLAHEAEAQ